MQLVLWKSLLVLPLHKAAPGGAASKPDSNSLSPLPPPTHHNQTQLSDVQSSWLSGTWGVWSSWGPWGPCSRSCGGGIAVQTRECIARGIAPGRRRQAGLNKRKHRKKDDDRERRKRDGEKKKKKKKGRSAQCVGQYRRVRVCGEQPCPRGSKDFRSEQCDAYNARNYSGRFYQWEPFLNAPDPCQLNCRARGYRFYATLNQTVSDGTPCWSRPAARTARAARPAARPGETERWLCMSGACQRVGCDGVLGSGARLDWCGVCAGDNSTCRLVSGLYTRPQLPQGHNLVTVLPRGACNLSIEQLRPTRNLLGLKQVGGAVLLNAGRTPSWPGVYEAAGTSFTYRHPAPAALPPQGESLSAPGPLTEPLELLLMYQQPNPGIRYEYSLPVVRRELGAAGAPPTAIALPAQPAQPPHPATDTPPGHPALRGAGGDDADDRFNEVLDERERADTARFPYGQDVLATDPGAGPPDPRSRKARRYLWRVTGLTECSKTCGGGTQMAVVQCVRENSLLPVSERRCQGQEKPSAYSVRCGSKPCPAQWSIGAWSGCSVTCGSGTQTREVSCRQEISSSLSVRVADAACLAPQPDVPRLQACRMGPCAHQAHQLHHHSHHHHHHGHREPPLAALAPQDFPGTWTSGPWSPCSTDCGKGIRTRVVSCPPGASCPSGTRPPAQEVCDAGSCSNHFWLTSEWSPHCSAECGTGVQSRSVACSAGVGSEAALQCDASQRPPHTRACSSSGQGGQACGGQWFSASWGPCSATCGQGVQTRGVSCLQWQRGQARYQVVEDSRCPAEHRPEQHQPCAQRACPPMWHAGEWSQCSRSCGTGAQKREVRCVGPSGSAASCPEGSRIPSRKSCHLQECAPAAPAAPAPAAPADSTPPETQDDTAADNGVACEDVLRNCHMVVQARLCKYSYYGNSCCSSCRRKGGD